MGRTRPSSSQERVSLLVVAAVGLRSGRLSGGAECSEPLVLAEWGAASPTAAGKPFIWLLCPDEHAGQEKRFPTALPSTQTAPQGPILGPHPIQLPGTDPAVQVGRALYPEGGGAVPEASSREYSFLYLRAAL